MNQWKFQLIHIQKHKFCIRTYSNLVMSKLENRRKLSAHSRCRPSYRFSVANSSQFFHKCRKVCTKGIGSCSFRRKIARSRLLPDFVDSNKWRPRLVRMVRNDFLFVEEFEIGNFSHKWLVELSHSTSRTRFQLWALYKIMMIIL